MKNVYVEHHYIVVSEHTEAIETYLEKAGKNNISIIKSLEWETSDDLVTDLVTFRQQELGKHLYRGRVK